MGLYKERGINFRQAQGIEKQCPLSGIIEITEDLIGKTAELLSGQKKNRDIFCHLKATDQQYSEGTPQVLTHAVLVPEIACKTTFSELLKQLDIVNGYKPERENGERTKILKKWLEVVSQNNHKESYDFGLLSPEDSMQEVMERVETFKNTFLSPLMNCAQSPKENIFDIN